MRRFQPWIIIWSFTARRARDTFYRNAQESRFQSALPAGSSIIMPAGLASLWHGPIPSSIRLRLSTLFLQQTADEIGRGTSNQAELSNVFLTRDLFVGRFAQIFEAELTIARAPRTDTCGRGCGMCPDGTSLTCLRCMRNSGQERSIRLAAKGLVLSDLLYAGQSG